MPRIKLVLEYDGTHYVGWQLQPNGPSIQGRLMRALQQLVGAPVDVFAAGRTDSGVHAQGQVVAFDSPVNLPLRAYWMGLNGLLPDDVAVVRAEEVAPAFDPRRWAKGKRYLYRLSNLRGRSPLRRLTHWEIFQPLDLEAMKLGATHLLGRHDFSSFRAAECEAKHPIRELTRVQFEGSAGDEIRFTVEGTAFLRHMVRNLIGTLVNVGRGKHPARWVQEVLEAKTREHAGVTAPPHGLTLMEVFYADPPGPHAPAESPQDE
ncbi:MAG: tRNA pseudouridine synthase [Myxococcaceae bacterium]|nr:tRNA pseudouridine synthase [Myxococcaceae bacterium]